ncbi:MAG: hypothetical protein J6Q08_00880 [Bacteroidaceae bacterium]|nr:hypothetical protein [Bacteroidaceae bacterium]
MSELSSLYVPQYQYDYNQAMERYESEIVYPWRDVTNYEEYFQSFNKYPERGYIDQSIFGFKRMDDDWSLGAYCSSIFTKDRNGVVMPDAATFYFHTSKNTLSKNQVALTTVRDIFYALNGTQGIHDYINSYDLINHHQYSPDSTKMAGYQATFISNFRYNKYCLIPKFSILYTDSNFLSYDISYNLIDQTRPFIVIGLTIDYGYAGSIPYIYPCFVQFAGSIQSCGAGAWNDPQMGEIVSAVYEMIGTNTIFGGLVHNGTKLADSSRITQTVFLNLPHLLTETHVTSGRRYWGMTLENAVTIVNRLGFYWTKAATYDGSALGTHCTNPDISVPVIDEETHTVTTQILEGSQIAQYAREHPDNILNCDVGAEDYNGETFAEFRDGYESDQSTVEETEEIDLNIPTVASTGGNTLWIMSEEKLEDLFKFLWDPDGTIFDDIVRGCALFGENPMDSVVSLKLFPFDISQVTTSAYRTMHFGRSPINDPVLVTTTRALTSSNLVVFDLGSFKFNDVGMFKDFRDYEPYSDYSLYIPFCGVVPLQAVECINTTISLKMIVDLIVGSATAVIYTNDVPYMYVDGNIGIDLPVTGRNCAELARTVLAGALAGGGILGRSAMHAGSSILSGGLNFAKNNLPNAGYNLNAGALNAAGEMGFFGSKAQAAIPSGTGLSLMGYGVGGALASAGAAAGGVAVAGVIGAAPFIAGAAAAALTHNAPPQSAGCNAPATGLAKPLYPYFIVRRSDSWIPENYNKLYGRPVQRGGKLSDFHGFCTFGNIRTDGLTGMTNEEKIQLVDLLAKGVII